MLFKNPSPQMMGYQNPQALRHLSQPMNPFPPPHRSHSHPPLTEAPTQPVPSALGNPLSLIETTTEEAKPPSDPLPTSKKRKRKGKREVEREASKTEHLPEIEYDETLLAIVGILEEVKHQSNVASWVKANGLWGPHPPQNLVDLDVDVLTDPSSREDTATLSDSGRHGERKKRRKDAITAFFEASVDGPKDGSSPNTPTNEIQNQENASETPLWFNNPPTMRHWIDRGRSALKTLGIPIEHGLRQ